MRGWRWGLWLVTVCGALGSLHCESDVSEPGGSTTTTTAATTSATTTGECPADMPERGTPCPAVGLHCDYVTTSDYTGCDGQPDPLSTYWDADCGEDGWSVTEDWHEDPSDMGTCPADVPTDGVPCPNSCMYSCDYVVELWCGDFDVYAECYANSSWDVTDHGCGGGGASGGGGHGGSGGS